MITVIKVMKAFTGLNTGAQDHFSLCITLETAQSLRDFVIATVKIPSNLITSAPHVKERLGYYHYDCHVAIHQIFNTHVPCLLANKLAKHIKSENGKVNCVYSVCIYMYMCDNYILSQRIILMALHWLLYLKILKNSCI